MCDDLILILYKYYPKNSITFLTLGCFFSTTG